MSEDWAPTAKLRFVERQVETRKGAQSVKILQQWWQPDVPAYMQNNEGEWRDVPLAAP